MNEQIIELETKIAFLEKSNNELSDVVYRQQQQIDALKTRLDHAIEKLQATIDDSSEQGEGAPPANEKPPHY